MREPIKNIHIDYENKELYINGRKIGIDGIENVCVDWSYRNIEINMDGNGYREVRENHE